MLNADSEACCSSLNSHFCKSIVLKQERLELQLRICLLFVVSKEQLSALLAKLKEDAGLLKKLKGAKDLDAAFAIAMDAGCDACKADWLKHQAKQALFAQSWW